MNRRMMVLAMAFALTAPGIVIGASKAEEQAEARKAGREALAAVEFGAQATAAAKTGDKGAAYQGAVGVAPGVWLYQFTGDGLALQLTAKGTKYYNDADLN